MHTAIRAPSNSLQSSLSWNPAETQSKTRKSIRIQRSFRFSIANSLRTSVDYESEKSREDGPSPSSPFHLPVVIRRSGRVSRYFWDGNSLRLVGVDGGALSVSFNIDDGFRALYTIFSSTVWDFFIPKKVSENYIEYVRWKFLHRVFSSALQVIATQAMFRAIGISYAHSFASAAAFKWILKDGLGRLSRCIYTASLASAFDTNLKRVRFSTSVWFSLSIGIELLTPAAPRYFLLLASVANIAKQISLTGYVATSSAVHRSFAIADNIGEVSAKAQIQSVCFDNLGLMLAAILSFFVKNDLRLRAALPFIVYPIFTAIDLFGIYQGLKHVHLQTLTKDRLEIILTVWIELGHLPSPAEVSTEEGIDFFGRKGKESCMPIRIGCLNPESLIPNLSMMAMRSVSLDDYYFISMEIFQSGPKRPGILVCLRDGASTSEIISGLLQACYVRKGILMKNMWEGVMEASDISSDVEVKEWVKLNEESKQRAKDEAGTLVEQMPKLGWSVKNVLLSTKEQCRYSFVDD